MFMLLLELISSTLGAMLQFRECFCIN